MNLKKFIMTRDEEKALNKKCQEALKEILKDTGYHARIVFYPGRKD